MQYNINASMCIIILSVIQYYYYWNIQPIILISEVFYYEIYITINIL